MLRNSSSCPPALLTTASWKINPFAYFSLNCLTTGINRSAEVLFHAPTLNTAYRSMTGFLRSIIFFRRSIICDAFSLDAYFCNSNKACAHSIGLSEAAASSNKSNDNSSKPSRVYNACTAETGFLPFFTSALSCGATALALRSNSNC